MLYGQIHDLSYYITLSGYLGILFFFLTIDQVTPVPEEISLLTIGYLSSKGIFNPVIGGAISLFAFLLVDSVYFSIAKSGTNKSKWFQNKRGNPVLVKLKKNIADHFKMTLLTLCFIPRMRMWAPIVTGLSGVAYTRFLKYDAIFLALFTLVYLSAGYFFHRGMAKLISEFTIKHDLIFFGLLVVIAVAIYFFRKIHATRSGL